METVNKEKRTDARLILDPNQEVLFTAEVYQDDEKATELGCTHLESVEIAMTTFYRLMTS